MKTVTSKNHGPLKRLEVRFELDSEAEWAIEQIAGGDPDGTTTLQWTNASISMATDEWPKCTEVRGPGGVAYWPKPKKRRRWRP